MHAPTTATSPPPPQRSAPNVTGPRAKVQNGRRSGFTRNDGNARLGLEFRLPQAQVETASETRDAVHGRRLKRRQRHVTPGGSAFHRRRLKRRQRHVTPELRYTEPAFGELEKDDFPRHTQRIEQDQRRQFARQPAAMPVWVCVGLQCVQG